MIKKILLVFGTRPEAIKMAPLYKVLKKNHNQFDTKVCVTGQHRQMLDQVIESFDIFVDEDLDLMTEDQDLFDVTSSVLTEMKRVLKEFNPDIVMVHGDTTTAFATSIACFYLQIPVWHVEAGLRTYDLKSPFPEEFNRQIITRVCEFHLAPTESSKFNLLDEGIEESKILVTGNTVIDSLFLTLNKIENEVGVKNTIMKKLDAIIPFDWTSHKFILITGHRRENFGQGFKNICEALRKSALEFPDVHFVYPLHMNPQVQSPVNEILGKINNIHIVPPMDYDMFSYLLKRCSFVVTDSGGIQEEAPSLGKPVLVMRNSTERPEAVQAGTVKLVGTDSNKIQKYISDLILEDDLYDSMSASENPYGDGKACDRILKALLEH